MPYRPLGATQYQPKDDVIRRLAEQNEGNVRRGMTTAFDKLKAALPMDRLTALLQNGDLKAILDQVPFDELEADMQDVFVQLGGIYDDAADARLQSLDVNQSLIRPFDRLDPEVLTALQTFRSDMVRQITDATRDALNQVLYTGVMAWKAPAEMATDIRSVVGLTDRQAQAVLNYRQLLEQGDLTALQRELRYRTYDPAFRRAVMNDSPLDPAKIDAMVDGYARNYLNYRATTIARTESIRAANRGARAGVEQATRRNIVGRDQVRRFWLIALDEKTCAFCRSVPDMNPDGVGLDEAYASIEGPVSGPDDSHPDCVPGDARCAPGGVLAATKRWFDGDLLVLSTASGKRLPVTPNHPILTRSGFIPAHLLNVGDQVVSRLAGDRHQGANLQGDDCEAAIQDIAEAFGRARGVAAREVPLSAPDFHGDAADDQIAVVWTDRHLVAHAKALCDQHRRDLPFIFGDAALLPFDRRCRLHLFSRASSATLHGLMGVGDLSLAGAAGHLGPFEPFSFRAAAYLHPSRQQARPDASAGNAEQFGTAIFGHAGLVGPDKITGIDVRSFHGFVFNLQTVSGAYAAEDIITHNCRCTETYQVNSEG